MPGIPSDDEIPDDAGISDGWMGASRRHGLLFWTLALVLGGFLLVTVTGTYGASLVTQDADLGAPGVVVEIDGSPTVAVTAGDFAVGVAVTDEQVYWLFGPTELRVPPGE